MQPQFNHFLGRLQYKPLPLSAKRPAAISIWVDVAAEKISWARTHGSTEVGCASHRYFKSVCTQGKFKLIWKSNTTLTLREEETWKTYLRLQDLLTEGTVTARQLKNIFLFPERLMKNCTNSVCGPGLPEESSTCKALPWLTSSKLVHWDVRVPLQSARAPQRLD